jgi:hypothetical protein
MQPRFLLATLALSATLALPVSDSGVRADSAPAQEVAQSEHHARVRRKAQATPDESMVLLSSIAQQFITKIATQNAVKPTSGGPDGLAAGGRGRGAGGGAGMRSQTNAIAKMVLGSLTAGQGQNSASVASQVLDAALDGLTDAQHGASTHAALVAQIMLAMFSTPDSQKIMSNPLSLKDPQVRGQRVAIASRQRVDTGRLFDLGTDGSWVEEVGKIKVAEVTAIGCRPALDPSLRPRTLTACPPASSPPRS